MITMKTGATVKVFAQRYRDPVVAVRIFAKEMRTGDILPSVEGLPVRGPMSLSPVEASGSG